MKYYYPTEISNLSSIFATQSISAPSIYLKRPFAPTVYHPIIDQHDTDALYLYKEAVPETIQERLGEVNVKKHPVVLEFDFDNREEAELYHIKREKYMSVNTIYLNSKKVRFILLHNDDKDFISDYILPSTVFSKIYTDSFFVEEPPYCRHIATELNHTDISRKAVYSGVRRSLDIDIFYNSVKGLYFGLLLGKATANKKTIDNIGDYVMKVGKQEVSTLDDKLLLSTITALIAFPRYVSPLSLIDIYVKEELLSRIEGLYALQPRLKRYIKDLEKIDKALKDSNYKPQLGEFQSNITRSLYIFMLCINTPKEIDTYLRKYQFAGNYLAYVFYATHVGYSGIPSYWYSRLDILKTSKDYGIEVYTLKLLQEIRNSTGFGKTRYSRHSSVG